ncbi:MAG: tyrosine-type recombinase/integrase [Chloroflexota bacterium]
MPNNALTNTDQDRQLLVGATADQYARTGVFADYQARRARNTLRRQQDDLATFADYLAAVQFYTAASDESLRLYSDPAAWSGITYGLIAGFVRWLLQNGYAVGTVNLKLSTVKQYAKLAFQAQALSAEQHALIRTVTGFQFKEHKRVSEQRCAAGTATRKGVKKAEAVSLDKSQVRALKTQPDTPQGRRDALLMCLLLDHGLRVGELAALDVTAFDLAAGLMIFDRPKVNKVQTHELTSDTLRAAWAWFASGDAPAIGKLLRGSRKGGRLTNVGMSERAITQRVADLGALIGVVGLSAHDLRHSWATRAARNKTDAFDLRDAGGWNSLAMPSRYVEAAKIANEGVNLGED